MCIQLLSYSVKNTVLQIMAYYDCCRLTEILGVAQVEPQQDVNLFFSIVISDRTDSMPQD